MKYIVLLGDGMSDKNLDELGGKTPLMAARTPRMDFIAKRGLFGLARTVPEGYAPGSDVANLSVFGYDPATCYSGRSPLEAASIGVELGPDDVAFRLNLVNLHHQGGKFFMHDYSAGHISAEEGRELLEALREKFESDEFQFFPGVGYRHLMIWRNGTDRMTVTPPHDITGQDIAYYLPKGEGAEQLIDLMSASQELLCSHPQYRKRVAADKLPANSIWFWGQGKAPRMESFRRKFGLSGAVISAVDLIRGIGVYAGLDIIRVPGATGYIDTNYRGKANAALKALETVDYVYLHVEAPDEAGHSGNLGDKITAIEQFDELVVGAVLDGIRRFGDYRVLCMPDHPTPVKLMTHTAAAVPFVIYSGEEAAHDEVAGYDEESAKRTGVYVGEGFRLMEMLMRG